MEAYLRIVRAPRVAPLLASTLLARLPIGINGLAVVLFLRAQHGSFSVAGLTGIVALGSARAPGPEAAVLLAPAAAAVGASISIARRGTLAPAR